MPIFQTTAKTITAQQAQELVDAICEEYSYQAEIPDGNGGVIPNPITKNIFSQSKFDEISYSWAKNIVITRRKRIAAQSVSNDTGL